MSEAMSFAEYQARATDTAIYPGQGGLMGLAYASLGLAGESGETVEQVKKTWRDDGVSEESFATHQVSDERRDKILKELGDVLWYAAQVCTELDATLEEVAFSNIEKLAERKRTNLIHGEGSNRRA